MNHTAPVLSVLPGRHPVAGCGAQPKPCARHPLAAQWCMACITLLAVSLVACTPRQAVSDVPAVINWEPDNDARLSYGVLLLDQALRADDPAGVLEAVHQMENVSPSAQPFVDAAAWLLLNRSPALARQVLTAALKRFPDDMNSHLLMAEAWLEDKQPDEAIAIVKAYSARHPASLQARQELAVVLTKAERYMEAEPIFASLPPAAHTAFVRYCHAKTLVGLGFKPAAIRELRAAVEDNPEFIEAWNDLASLIEDRKEFHEAATIYEHILEQDPSNHDTWLRLVALYLAAGDRKSALEVAKNYQDSMGLAFSAVSLFIEKGLFAEADILLALMRKSPDVPEEINFFMAASAYEGRKAVQESLTLLEKVGPTNRYYEKSLRFRAQILFEHQRMDEALTVLRQAQATFPDDRSFRLMEAHVLNQTKRHDAALVAIEEACRRWPDDLDIRYMRGMLLEATGRKTEAMSLMEDLIAANPEYYQALNFIGYALAEQQRDLPRALELLQRADGLSPNTAHILDSLAWAQFQAGHLTQAWDTISRAVTLEGGQDAVIWEHYGDIATACGKSSEAQKGYTQALERGHEQPDAIRKKMDKP